MQEFYNRIIEDSKNYWAGLTKINVGMKKYDNLYVAARNAIHASISETGKMNAGIWLYNVEWVRDSSFVALAAIMSGQFKLGYKILNRLLTYFCDDLGRTSGEGGWFEPNRAELDMSGEVVYVLWTYWVFTGDDSLIRRYWNRLKKVIEYPLQPIFWCEKAGMVHNEREIFERDYDRHGIEDGFDIGTEFWVSKGLEKASEIASHLKDEKYAERWMNYSKKIRESMIHNKKYRLIEKGHLIKRKKLNGEIQRYARFSGLPPAIKRFEKQELDPDSLLAFPIAYRMIDPESSLSIFTIEHLEKLWNQFWNIGGYPKFDNSASHPGTFGPGPLGTMLITRACMEAREYKKVLRSLDWLLTTYGGKGYCWMEYIDADPEHTPEYELGIECGIGITPWNAWAELIMLYVCNWLGFQPEQNKIFIRPKLILGMSDMKAKVKFRNCHININVKGKGKRCINALQNGQRLADNEIMSDGACIDIPDSDINLELIFASAEGRTSDKNKKDG